MNTSSKLRTRIGRRAGVCCCAGAIALAANAGTASATDLERSFKPGASGAPVVKVAQGVVRGRTVGAHVEFLGLPYAAPPVGALRWRPPAPAPRWDGVRDGTVFGSNCAQPDSPFGLPSFSEDCLYLNVYAPTGVRHGRDKRPVMVWVHGGALWVGEGNDYDPAKLAADGTVVVTINYRLGALGFLAHPALADRPGGSSGNWGLMDQQAALGWVQRNIRRFGGDRHNVTLAGESAGGWSVLAQLVSPGARGLFHRAIVQTGAFAQTQKPLADAETEGEAFATKVGCADQTAACLRGLPVSAIRAMDTRGPLGPALGNPTGGFQPGVIDGKVLKQSIGKAIARGRFNRVPILNGTNHDEARLFAAIDVLSGVPVTAANYEARISLLLSVSPAVAARVAAEYPLAAYPSPILAFSAVDTDAVDACPALELDELTSNFVPTFAYEFNDRNAPQRFLPPLGFPYGAYHIAETQYLFDLPSPSRGSARRPGMMTPEQQMLAASMKRYWASFAAAGVPSAAGEPDWPRFDSQSQQMLSLEPSRSRVKTDFAADHHCDFWATIR